MPSSTSTSSLHQPLLPNSLSGGDNNNGCLLDYHRHIDRGRDRRGHHDDHQLPVLATSSSAATYHHIDHDQASDEDLERDGNHDDGEQNSNVSNNVSNNSNCNDDNSSDGDENNNDDNNNNPMDGDDVTSLGRLVIDTTTSSSSIIRSRFVLIFVSFLFATFNISARAVYSFDDAPSPSVLSTIRGYMVVIFFVPLLINKQRRQQRIQQQQEEEQLEEEERQEEQSKNSILHTATTTRTKTTSRDDLVGDDKNEDENDGDVEDQTSIFSLHSTSESLTQQQQENDDQKTDITDDRNDDVVENNRSNRMVGLPPSPPPQTPKSSWQWPWPSSSSSMWRPALELSVYNFISQACYNVGIGSVSSSARASFLGQSSVIMTPFIVVVLSSTLPSFITTTSPRRRNGNQPQHDISVATWTGCFVAMVGLSFLSWTPTSDTTTDITTNTTLTTEPTVPIDEWDAKTTTVISFMVSKLMNSDIEEEEDGEDILEGSLLQRITSSSSSKVGLSFGDSMILLSSFTWSFYIIRTCSHSTKYDEVYLQGLKNIFNALFYTTWWLLGSNFGRDCLWSGWNGPMAVASWSILTYSAFGPGILADLLQQNAQGSVPASEANIILSMEPIFTAVLGLTLLHEKLTWNECLGGCFLVLGSLVASSMATGPIQTLSPEH